MKQGLLVVVGLLAIFALTVPLGGQQAPAAIETHKMHGAMKFEAAVAGFVGPLKGQFKLRATEVDFEPGGRFGDHLHAGPGLRYVLAGELTFRHPTGEERLVKTGEYLYEAGDVSIRVENRGAAPARMLAVELLPADWQGSAAVPLARRAELEQRAAQVQQQLCGAR